MNVAEKPPVANAEIRIPTRTCPGCGEAVPDAEVRANACVCPAASIISRCRSAHVLRTDRRTASASCLTRRYSPTR